MSTPNAAAVPEPVSDAGINLPSGGTHRSRGLLSPVYVNGWDNLIYTHISVEVLGEKGRFLINQFCHRFDEICASKKVCFLSACTAILWADRLSRLRRPDAIGSRAIAAG
ncbi:MAG: hypothetical protein ABI476_01635 [Oxalobacteraceae bacterium]